MHLISNKGAEKSESVLDRDGSPEHLWETSYTPAAPRAPSEGGEASCAQGMKRIEHDCPCVPPTATSAAGSRCPAAGLGVTAGRGRKGETRAYAGMLSQDAKGIPPTAPRLCNGRHLPKEEKKKNPPRYTLLRSAHRKPSTRGQGELEIHPSGHGAVWRTQSPGASLPRPGG